MARVRRWRMRLRAQAPANVLAGVLTDDLCPAAVPVRAICGAGVGDAGALQPAKLPVPWLAAAALPGARCEKPAATDFVARVAQARGLARVEPAASCCRACAPRCVHSATSAA